MGFFITGAYEQIRTADLLLTMQITIVDISTFTGFMLVAR